MRGACCLGVPGSEPLRPHPRCCLCPTRPRFAPGVTIEEDNCCGCNAIAIRRHFLDENMTAVDIVYTSCHDAVRGWGGRARLCAAAPSCCPLRAAAWWVPSRSAPAAEAFGFAGTADSNLGRPGWALLPTPTLVLGSRPQTHTL